MEVLIVLKEILIGAAGIGAGYLIARNHLEKKYARLLDEEIQRTKEFFGGTYEGSKEGLDSPEFMEAAIDAASALTEYSRGEISVTPATLAQNVERVVVKNYQKPETIVEEEAADIGKGGMLTAPVVHQPDPDARSPYLVPFAVFDAAAEEVNHDQFSLSFFAGDGVVLDEDDNIVPPERVEQIIGTENLNRFGSLTDDPDMEPNVIYIRCERFEMDFEVTRSPGKYAVEVQGQAG